MSPPLHRVRYAWWLRVKLMLLGHLVAIDRLAQAAEGDVDTIGLAGRGASHLQEASPRALRHEGA